MTLLELFLTAVGLSMDAFAVAVCIGLALPQATLRHSTLVGAYFGGFQGLMPLAGFFLGYRFADRIVAYDHWIAFVLLAFIGGRMIQEALSQGDSCPVYQGLGPRTMLPLAVATSIDALAVGVTLAFLRVDILPAVTFIGVVTFLLSATGVRVGQVFGSRYKSKAELMGGGILVLMGAKILVEHTVGL